MALLFCHYKAALACIYLNWSNKLSYQQFFVEQQSGMFNLIMTFTLANYRKHVKTLTYKATPLNCSF